MTVELAYPFTGRWLVQNSPANKVPSHGTRLFATSYAIDFVPVDERGRSAPIGWRALTRTEPPETFVGFGRPVLSPIAGSVVVAHNDVDDHDSYRGLASISYALTQARRVGEGWRSLAGNHVVVEASPGVLVALCHLKRDSLQVQVGQRVAVGDPIGGCGNSGNSTEPHLHLQAFNARDPEYAQALPITFCGGLPQNRQVISG